MNRVNNAIRQGKALLAVGSRAMADGKVQAELTRLAAIPMVALGGEPSAGARFSAGPVNACAVEQVVASGGGVVVLLEPNPSTDGRGLQQLADQLSKARNKPRVFVVTRSFNPFSLPMSMRLMKLEGMKFRTHDFLMQVHAPAAAPVAAAGKKAKKKASRPSAPRPEFLDREDLVAELGPALTDGGPMVLLGSPGAGKRWLAEKLIADAVEAGAKRLPDINLRRGCGSTRSWR